MCANLGGDKSRQIRFIHKMTLTFPQIQLVSNVFLHLCLKINASRLRPWAQSAKEHSIFFPIPHVGHLVNDPVAVVPVLLLS